MDQFCQQFFRLLCRIVDAFFRDVDNGFDVPCVHGENVRVKASVFVHLRIEERLRVVNAFFDAFVVILYGMLAVPKQIVVLGGEATFARAAGAIGPNDLILEVFNSENFVEFHFDVVSGVMIEMHHEVPCGLQKPSHFNEANAHPTDVVFEAGPRVVERAFLAGAAHFGGELSFGEERRVDVNQIEALSR